MKQKIKDTVISMTVAFIISLFTIPEVSALEISGDFDITQTSSYTAEQLTYAVSDENRILMAEYIDTFLEAEQEYGINALYLMCKFGLESGWGRYQSGENNIGGWKCSDGTYMDFDSVDECIMYIAEKLSTDYTDATGTRLKDVCGRYCPDDGYSQLLIDIMNGRINKIEERLKNNS